MELQTLLTALDESYFDIKNIRLIVKNNSRPIYNKDYRFMYRYLPMEIHSIAIYTIEDNNYIVISDYPAEMLTKQCNYGEVRNFKIIYNNMYSITNNIYTECIGVKIFRDIISKYHVSKDSHIYAVYGNSEMIRNVFHLAVPVIWLEISDLTTHNTSHELTMRTEIGYSVLEDSKKYDWFYGMDCMNASSFYSVYKYYDDSNKLHKHKFGIGAVATVQNKNEAHVKCTTFVTGKSREETDKLLDVLCDDWYIDYVCYPNIGDILRAIDLQVAVDDGYINHLIQTAILFRYDDIDLGKKTFIRGCVSLEVDNNNDIILYTDTYYGKERNTPCNDWRKTFESNKGLSG